MKKNIIDELDEIIENELYYLNEIKVDKKDKIKNRIIKEMKKRINMDLFIYRFMNNDHCTFKHNIGKNYKKWR
jgi:predicted RNase H-related nuclease YkuK (DUF458 family)